MVWQAVRRFPQHAVGGEEVGGQLEQQRGLDQRPAHPDQGAGWVQKKRKKENFLRTWQNTTLNTINTIQFKHYEYQHITTTH